MFNLKILNLWGSDLGPKSTMVVMKFLQSNSITADESNTQKRNA